ncbi:MAG: hypothetical protein HZA50_18200 [Planctomycetes bacterium]|nr:hypothetical protein [Planctomycetota bacterium]
MRTGLILATCLTCVLQIIVYGDSAGPATSTVSPDTAAAARPAISRPAVKRPAASQPSTAQATADLQEMVNQILGQVEEIRGWKYKKTVGAEVLTNEQVKAHMDKEIDADLKPGEYEQLQAFMKLTGLIPPDCDIKQTFKNFVADQAGGFYSSKTGKYYMPLRVYDEFSTTYKGIITSHELTHAMDDQYFNLEKIAKSREETEDWSLAWRSVAEGSATISMTQYLVALSKSGKLDMAEMTRMALKEQKEAAKLAKLPTYFMSLVMVYTVGPPFLLKGKDLRTVVLSEPQALEKLGDVLLATAKNPPLSSEQVLHPEKYWDKAKLDEPVMVRDADMEKIFSKMDLKSVYRNTIGEMLCSILSRRDQFDTDILTSASRCTNRAAAGWGGDRFYLLLPAGTPGSLPASIPSDAPDGPASRASAAAGFSGVWITLWDAPRDVGEFQTAYEKYRPLKNRLSFPLGKRGMVFCFGLSDEQVQKLKSVLEADPPAFTQSGKNWTLDAPATQTQPASGSAESSSPAAKVGETAAPADKPDN